MNLRQWRAIFIALVVATLGWSASAYAQACGSMDVVFVVDTTGSMGGAIGNVKADLPNIISAVESASGGDFRLGLIEFHNDVHVIADLAGGNVDAVQAGINGLTASGGGAEPEASDEAVRTAVEALPASARSAGNQTGDFSPFRSDATKIIILITDARPAGFDDTFSDVDDANVTAIASEAAAKGIRISAVFVPTEAADFFGVTDVVSSIMQRYATLSGGLYTKANSDGTGTSVSINEIITSCGGSSGSLILDPLELPLSNGESADVSVTNFRPGDASTLVYASSGLLEDSTVTFSSRKATVTGTDLRNMHILIGPDTPAGVYPVTVTATHTGKVGSQSAYVLVFVDCTPPLILGTGQPGATKLGTAITVKPVGSLGLRYQWYRGHTGSTAFPIAGATSATFTPTKAGEYWVRVTNACGSTDSASAVVR